MRVRVGAHHLQNSLADKPKLSNFKNTRKQLPSLKNARVTFAALPVLFEQTHSTPPMSVVPFILHASDIRFKKIGAHNHCLGCVYLISAEAFKFKRHRLQVSGECSKESFKSVSSDIIAETKDV